MNGYLSGDALAFAAKSVAGIIFFEWFIASYPEFAKFTHLDRLRFPGTHHDPEPPPDVPSTEHQSNPTDIFGNNNPDYNYTYVVEFDYWNPFNNSNIHGREAFKLAVDRDNWIAAQGARIYNIKKYTISQPAAGNA